MNVRNEMSSVLSPASYPVRAPIPTKGSMRYWTSNPTKDATTIVLSTLGFIGIPSLFTEAARESLAGLADPPDWSWTPRDLPHAAQNLAPSLFACPQEAQNNC